jgi:hypothetical protein
VDVFGDGDSPGFGAVVLEPGGFDFGGAAGVVVGVGVVAGGVVGVGVAVGVVVEAVVVDGDGVGGGGPLFVALALGAGAAAGGRLQPLRLLRPGRFSSWVR